MEHSRPTEAQGHILMHSDKPRDSREELCKIPLAFLPFTAPLLLQAQPQGAWDSSLGPWNSVPDPGADIDRRSPWVTTIGCM